MTSKISDEFRVKDVSVIKFCHVDPTLLEKYHSITMVLIPWYFGAVYFTMVLLTMVKYILPWYPAYIYIYLQNFHSPIRTRLLPER